MISYKVVSTIQITQNIQDYLGCTPIKEGSTKGNQAHKNNEPFKIKRSKDFKPHGHKMTLKQILHYKYPLTVSFFKTLTQSPELLASVVRGLRSNRTPYPEETTQRLKDYLKYVVSHYRTNTATTRQTVQLVEKLELFIDGKTAPPIAPKPKGIHKRTANHKPPTFLHKFPTTTVKPDSTNTVQTASQSSTITSDHVWRATYEDQDKVSDLIKFFSKNKLK